MKKSFKSHPSYKHTRRMSSAGGGSGSSDSSVSHEESPMLSHHVHRRSEESRLQSSSPSPSSLALGGATTHDDDDDDDNEVIVKVEAACHETHDRHSDGSSGSSCSSSRTGGNNINNNNNRIQREPSFDILQNYDLQNQAMEDSAHSKEKASGGEISLDMDVEIDQSFRTNRPPSFADQAPFSKQLSSREIRVSFDPSVSGIDSTADSVRRRYKEESFDGRDEVLKCTANASFKRQTSVLSRLKTTKSRLLDPPPEEIQRMSMSSRLQKSGQLRSGMLSRVTDDEDDEDFEDVPDEFKNTKISTLTILQWVSLIAIIGALVCSLCVPALKKLAVLRLKIWKWEVLLLVLICGRLVSGWGIRLIVFFIERNFLLRKRVLYFVYGLRKGVQNCLWLGLVLLAWHLLFDKKVQRETQNHIIKLKYLTKILVCFLVANFMWLIKTLMVKVLASSFHVSTYFDRIQDSVFNQFVIETLSGPPLIEIQKNEEDLERAAVEVRRLQEAGAKMPPELKAAVFPPSNKSGRMINAGGVQKSFKAAKSIKFSRQLSKKGEKKVDEIPIDHLNKLNPKNVSAWNMKRLIKIVKQGSLSTLDEQIMGATDEDESTRQIRSEYEAKAAAKKIFFNVARRESKYIYLEDIMRFMREDEALRTMSSFEGASESSRISKSCLKNWVVNAFRERRALALTLNDTKTAVNKLHQMINVIVAIIIIILWLLILGIAPSKFFVVIGSQIVVVSFIFGNTAKTLFESIIFLFFIHPFDVGDRCEVDGVQMIVEEMNILTTVFLRADNLKIVYPNSVLATKAIGNYYRSPDMGDSVEFCIHIATPPDKINIMKQRIISCIENKKEHWYQTPPPTVALKEVEQFNMLRIMVWMRHRINHQDMGEKWLRRALLLEEIVKIFRELDIQYRLWPLDINILSMPPPFNSSSLPPLETRKECPV